MREELDRPGFPLLHESGIPLIRQGEKDLLDECGGLKLAMFEKAVGLPWARGMVISTCEDIRDRLIDVREYRAELEAKGAQVPREVVDCENSLVEAIADMQAGLLKGE